MLDSHTPDFFNPVFIKGLRHLLKTALLPIIIVVQLLVNYNFYTSSKDLPVCYNGNMDSLMSQFATTRLLLLIIMGFLVVAPFLREKDKEGLDISLGTRISPFSIMAGQFLTLAFAFIVIYLTSLPMELILAPFWKTFPSDLSTIATAFCAAALLSVVSRQDTRNIFLAIPIGGLVIFIIAIVLHAFEQESSLHPLFFVTVKLCALAVLAIHLAASYSPYNSRHGHHARLLSLAMAIAFIQICNLCDNFSIKSIQEFFLNAITLLTIIQGFLAVTAPTMPLRRQTRGLTPLHWKNGFSLFSPEAVPNLLMGYLFACLGLAALAFLHIGLSSSSTVFVFTMYGLVYASIILLLKHLGVSTSKACGIVLGIFFLLAFCSTISYGMRDNYLYSMFLPPDNIVNANLPSVLILGLVFLAYPACAYYLRILKGRIHQGQGSKQLE